MTDEDLTQERLVAAMPGRPLRAYPAVVSTEADAMAWARAGGSAGSVVVAGYQVSARGRGGIPWLVSPARSLAFSVVLRPELAAEREGWLYLVATAALRTIADGSLVDWPDAVRLGGEVAGRVAVQTEVGPNGVSWAVVSLLVTDAPPPREALVARLVEELEVWSERTAAQVLDAHRRWCDTLGRRVRARIMPIGPRGVVVEGTARDVDDAGSLLVRTDAGRVQPVRPQDVGVLEVL